MVHAEAKNKCAGRCSDILVFLLELAAHLGSFSAQVSQNKIFSTVNFSSEMHIASWNAVFPCVAAPHMWRFP